MSRKRTADVAGSGSEEGAAARARARLQQLLDEDAGQAVESGGLSASAGAAATDARLRLRELEKEIVDSKAQAAQLQQQCASITSELAHLKLDYKALVRTREKGELGRWGEGSELCDLQPLPRLLWESISAWAKQWSLASLASSRRQQARRLVDLQRIFLACPRFFFFLFRCKGACRTYRRFGAAATLFGGSGNHTAE